MLKDVRIPLAPLIPHVRTYLQMSDSTPTQFDRELGLPVDTTRIILVGRNRTVEFNLADRIITTINPFLWRTDPELSRIYQEVDFSQAKEYDEETQFPCGHPRTEDNIRRRARSNRPAGMQATCRLCSNQKIKRRRHEVASQLSLIRDAA